MWRGRGSRCGMNDKFIENGWARTSPESGAQSPTSFDCRMRNPAVAGLRAGTCRAPDCGAVVTKFTIITKITLRSFVGNGGNHRICSVIFLRDPEYARFKHIFDRHGQVWTAKNAKAERVTPDGSVVGQIG